MVTQHKRQVAIMDGGSFNFLGVLAIWFILQFGLLDVLLVILAACLIFTFKQSVLALSIMVGFLILFYGFFVMKEYISKKWPNETKISRTR